jgi:hypothetical protein
MPPGKFTYTIEVERDTSGNSSVVLSLTEISPPSSEHELGVLHEFEVKSDEHILIGLASDGRLRGTVQEHI